VNKDRRHTSKPSTTRTNRASTTISPRRTRRPSRKRKSLIRTKRNKPPAHVRLARAGRDPGTISSRSSLARHAPRRLRHVGVQRLDRISRVGTARNNGIERVGDWCTHASVIPRQQRRVLIRVAGVPSRGPSSAVATVTIRYTSAGAAPSWPIHTSLTTLGSGASTVSETGGANGGCLHPRVKDR
jgi:hypothetical protein